MSGMKGVRIVNTSTNGNPNMTDVYDLETGEKMLYVYGVSVDITRGHLEVTVKQAMPFEYEGPAHIEIVRPDGTTHDE